MESRSHQQLAHFHMDGIWADCNVCCLEKINKQKETIKSLREALGIIPPLKLRALADWLDVKFPDDKNNEVQKDLCLMAKRSFEALAQADEVLK